MEQQRYIAGDFPLVYVQGTGTNHYNFGLENNQLKMAVSDFYISPAAAGLAKRNLW